MSSLLRICPNFTINKWLSIHTREWDRRGHLGMDPVVFYPFSYQVTQRYIALNTYNINCVTIAYSDIWHTRSISFCNFTGSVSRSIFHITAYTSIYIQYHLLVIFLCNCILRKVYWVLFPCRQFLQLHTHRFESGIIYQSFGQLRLQPGHIFILCLISS